MTRTSRAWVLDIGGGQRVAVGAPQVVEYLLATETISMPRTPAHCAGLLIWRDKMIPIIDLARLLTEGDARTSPTGRAVILAYQDAPSQPLRYGALGVAAAPIEVLVNDDMAGVPTSIPPAFGPIARACFTQGDTAIAILDVRQLFSQPLAIVDASGSKRPTAQCANASD